MKKIYLFAMVSVLFFSCETVVTNVDIPTIEQKTVVQVGLTNLFDQQEGVLTKTDPVFDNSGDEFEVEEDALMVVVSNQGQDTLFYSSSEERYFGKMSNDFVVGQRYDLYVKLNDGKELSASDVYPAKPINLSYDVDSTTRDDHTVYNYTVHWDRTATENDFYQIEVIAIHEFDGRLDTFSTYGANPYVNGSDYSTSRISRKGTFANFSIFGEQTLKKLIFVVSGITEAHYKYGRFLYDYEPENPFSEPVTIPSNIQGGLGMFVLKNAEQIEF